MTSIDRRSALALGLMAARTRSAPAQSTLERIEEPATLTNLADPLLTRSNPVVFWSNVSLALVKLDHSIEDKYARAPGPCTTARALGLIHVVIADAVRSAYPSARYAGLMNVGSITSVRSRALFVGGAAAAILKHIYDTQTHAAFINLKQADFIRMHGSRNMDDWRKGIDFGSSQVFTSRWKWNQIWNLISPSDSAYMAGPRQHDVDPYNCNQGFYGQRWGEEAPLVLAAQEVTRDCAPPPPPPEGSKDYELDLKEVRELGVLRGTPNNPRPTKDQIDIGLFWAYDGARLIGPSPRLYNQILLDVAKKDGMSTVELARLLALCNLAMADAGIVAWHAKYLRKVWRPVLGIRNHRTSPDADWRPLGSPRTNRPYLTRNPKLLAIESAQRVLSGGVTARSLDEKRRCDPYLDPAYAAAAFTPNFPSYPSGHAIFGAACFDMLRRVRGERPATRDDPDKLGIDCVSEEVDGSAIDNFRDVLRPRRVKRFEKIEDMIEQNSRSRIYLGVHWNFDAVGGNASGKRVAAVVHSRVYERL
jgi:membrane-associated phospholipid phosphatase